MVSTGINGFGRFGLHLLKYWLDRRKSTNFSIDFVNDDFLSPQMALAIILNDPFVKITTDYVVTLKDDNLAFVDRNGFEHSLFFSNTNKEQIPWRGKPDIMLECSGKHCNAKLNREYLEENTDKIVISATVADADQTLIMGFNHEDYNPKAQVYSYGSCIINAFVPLTNWLNQQYQLLDCDSTIIHNMPEYKLLKRGNNTLQRRSCSLAWMGPKLLDCLNPNNFTVTKTYVPYPGISMIDMRYRLAAPVPIESIEIALKQVFETGPLKTFYAFEQNNQLPAAHLNSPFSAILRRQGLQLVGDNLYISCYFDNENSVNRYYDLLNHMT